MVEDSQAIWKVALAVRRTCLIPGCVSGPGETPHQTQDNTLTNELVKWYLEFHMEVVHQRMPVRDAGMIEA